MIRVQVKILGALAKPMGKADFELELEEQACLEDLLLKAGYQQSHLRFLIPAVNGEQAKLGHPMKDGDQVLLVLPTSGG